MRFLNNAQVSGTATASNLAGTNTGDNVPASDAGAGTMSAADYLQTKQSMAGDADYAEVSFHAAFSDTSGMADNGGWNFGAGGGRSSKYGSVAFGPTAVSSRYGEEAIAGGFFVNAGDAQQIVDTLYLRTTSATAGVLLLGDGNRFVLPTNKAYSVFMTVLGVSEAGTAFANFVRNFVIANVNGTVAVEGTVNVPVADTGTGLVSTPANGTLTQAAAGALVATTYFVKSTYVNANGETLPATETSLAVSASNILKVASPAASAGATGWNVYISTATNTETRQNIATIPIGQNWMTGVEGLYAGGAAVPGATTATTIPAGWAMAVSADNVNKALQVQVTGAAATNIRWVASIEAVELQII